MRRIITEGEGPGQGQATTKRQVVSQLIKDVFTRAVQLPTQQLPVGLPVTACVFLKPKGSLPASCVQKSGSLSCEISLPGVYRFIDNVWTGTEKNEKFTPKIPVAQLVYAYYKWKSPQVWDNMNVVQQWKVWNEEWKPYFSSKGGTIMHSCDMSSCVNQNHLTISNTLPNPDNARCQGYQLYDDCVVKVCSHVPTCNRVFIHKGRATIVSVNAEQRSALELMSRNQEKIRQLQRSKGTDQEDGKRDAKRDAKRAKLDH